VSKVSQGKLLGAGPGCGAKGVCFGFCIDWIRRKKKGKFSLAESKPDKPQPSTLSEQDQRFRLQRKVDRRLRQVQMACQEAVDGADFEDWEFPELLLALNQLPGFAGLSGAVARPLAAPQDFILKPNERGEDDPGLLKDALTRVLEVGKKTSQALYYVLTMFGHQLKGRQGKAGLILGESEAHALGLAVKHNRKSQLEYVHLFDPNYGEWLFSEPNAVQECGDLGKALWELYEKGKTRYSAYKLERFW
jgi:hypothetical protein